MSPRAAERKRTELVNIGVTPVKELLGAAAGHRGYRGVGDFVRTSTLAYLG